MRVDHLVWYCSDLSAGERHFADCMDHQPAFSGTHPREGTRNSLLSLGEATYLEILAPDPAQDRAVLDSELAALPGPGLYHWAIGGIDLEQVRDRALATGCACSDIVAGGRALPAGGRLSWKLFGLRDHTFGALVPFFIDWTDSEHPARTAPEGGRLERIEVLSPEKPALAELFRDLGIDLPVVGSERPGLAATIATRSGSQRLEMIGPVPRGFII
jgi:Glyoxalase-like domain